MLVKNIEITYCVISRDIYSLTILGNLPREMSASQPQTINQVHQI